MARPEWQTSDSARCRPRKDERLSWPIWLTYSGRYTHISGHASGADRAEVEKVRLSETDVLTTELRNQLCVCVYCVDVACYRKETERNMLTSMKH